MNPPKRPGFFHAQKNQGPRQAASGRLSSPDLRSVAPVVLVCQVTEPREPRNGRGRIAVRFIRASRFTWKPQGMLLFLGRFSPQHSAGHLWISCLFLSFWSGYLRLVECSNFDWSLPCNILLVRRSNRLTSSHLYHLIHRLCRGGGQETPREPGSFNNFSKLKATFRISVFGSVFSSGSSLKI